ncbi:hypothetical protein CTRI78_v009565 [Colletotrichum trifolii]|uniref:Uncharacterized protein n=1 Tax=Colletotrichum trifolii TaxID=5466 RepID=A0A4V3HTX9_COLTR|nr:hypothetical protein CTRI78_v009565 [Colletotrichum trifolii]
MWGRVPPEALPATSASVLAMRGPRWGYFRHCSERFRRSEGTGGGGGNAIAKS